MADCQTIVLTTAAVLNPEPGLNVKVFIHNNSIIHLAFSASVHTEFYGLGVSSQLSKKIWLALSTLVVSGGTRLRGCPIPPKLRVGPGRLASWQKRTVDSVTRRFVS